MTVYDISNIEHCTVQEIGNPPIMFRIIAEEGWYIHCPEHAENQYVGAVALRAVYDFSQVQIIPESELPPDYVINGEDEQPETETMGETEEPKTEAE